MERAELIATIKAASEADRDVRIGVLRVIDRTEGVDTVDDLGDEMLEALVEFAEGIVSLAPDDVYESGSFARSDSDEPCSNEDCIDGWVIDSDGEGDGMAACPVCGGPGVVGVRLTG